nr:hypothetical protein [Tanacetum cinerariifolium]
TAAMESENWRMVFGCTRPAMRHAQSVATAATHLGQRDAKPAVSTSFTGHVALRAARFR